MGVQFRPLKRINKRREGFRGFSTVVPVSSTKKLNAFIRSLSLHRKTKLDIYQIAELINNRIQGWFNYFYEWDIKTNCSNFFYRLNIKLLKWANNRYKRLKGKKRTIGLMRQIQRQMPDLFVHWKYGFVIRPYN